MIVEVRALQKVYEGKQRVVAVDGIDLNVEAGAIYGLLLIAIMGIAPAGVAGLARALVRRASRLSL